jgi:protein-disulfide isomerase
MVKEPVSIALTCNEKDREILAQQEKMAKEYYQQRGAELKDSSAIKTPVAPIPSPKTGDLFATGRCGRVTLTWVEEKEINKERIEIKRRKGDGDYSLIKTGMVYDKTEGQGRRYWVSDSGLIDGTTYEYLISFKDASGKEGVRGPASIILTCTDQDKALEAQREQAIKEYYQKRGIDYSALKTPAYQLSKEVATVTIGNSPRKGSADAPVTLVVFTDFECVHCATWAQTLDDVQKTFSSDVKIVFKNFLIPYHKNSDLAAKAALAAGEQGKFWEMHDLLFKNQNALTQDDILGYAKSIKLDLATFQEYLESEKAKIIIEKDKAQGKLLGVENAPTTFINGRSLVGSPPFSHVKKLIEDIFKNKI